MTHPSEYITQGKHKYTLFFRIEECGGAYYINSHIKDYDTLDFEVLEFVAWSAKEALKYVGHCCAVFGGFEPKILQFDKEYPEEFVQKTLREWLG